MDLDRFQTNEAAETEGVWVDLSDTARVKVARLNNPRYQAHVQAAMKPYRHQVRAGTLPDSVLEKITIEAMASTILLDWKGVTRAGKELKYSSKAATEALTELRDFRECIAEIAQSAEMYRQQAVEDASGN